MGFICCGGQASILGFCTRATKVSPPQGGDVMGDRGVVFFTQRAQRQLSLGEILVHAKGAKAFGGL